MGTSITFKRPDGQDASGYLANTARGNAPGVVVIQEWWGLQDQIKGMCDRFAIAGFDALAPDLYKGTSALHWPGSMRWRPISTRARWCPITTPMRRAKR